MKKYDPLTVVNSLLNSAHNGSIAQHLLGPDWLPEYLKRANTGGIERVWVWV